MVPLCRCRFRGNKFDQLGRRLTQAGTHARAAEEDLGLLEQVLSAYDDVLTDVALRLRRAGFTPTTRPKTTQTIIQKLVRTPGLTIRGIHDLAGARIIIDGGRLEQNSAVDRIVDLFSDGDKPCQILDRRESPSEGYRAVHVVAYMDRLPVEIQVRTDLQHRWAEIMESLADRWGRAIRYGGEPDGPESSVLPDSQLTRREFVAELIQWSETINMFEELALEHSTGHVAAGQTTPRVMALHERLRSLEDSLRARLNLYLMLFDRLE